MGEKQLILDGLSTSATATLKEIARLQLSNEVPERTIVLIATLGETYFDGMLTSLIALEDGSRSAMYEALLGDVRESIHSSWPSKFEWMRKGFGLSLQGMRGVQDFNCCVDLRNLIIHGNGRLTRMQTKQFDKSIELRKSLERVMNVTMQGNRVIVDFASAQAGIRIARSFVTCVDREILAKYPTLISL